MNAAIITIGDEILIGQITDTNSGWIASQLSLLGISVTEIRSISDNHDHITNTLNDFLGKMDLVILTGGLGPTRDDTTKEALNRYFGGKLILHTEVLEHINSLFLSRGMSVSELNRLQAVLPDTCTPLFNPSGTAPGMLFRKNNTVFVSLPGVPYEMKDIFNTQLIPHIRNMRNGKILLHRYVMTQGLPESYLAAKISDWENDLPSCIKLAYLPRPGIVRLRLSGISDNPEKLALEMDRRVEELKKILPLEIYATVDISLEAYLAELMTHAGVTLAVAESCTGGSISAALTSIPGSSTYFKGGVVAYSNEVKTGELGISPSILDNYGAVSRETVTAMAENIRIKWDTDFGIGVSGIAGPGGGTTDKPVGLTWIAVSSRENCISRKFTFGEHRGRNVEKAVQSALNLLRLKILNLVDK